MASYVYWNQRHVSVTVTLRFPSHAQGYGPLSLEVVTVSLCGVLEEFVLGVWMPVLELVTY
jgi:hypothetical protein